MDHLLARQVVRGGDFGAAGGAAVQCAAFAQEAAAGGGVDGAVDAAAAEEGFVGCVDDGVEGQGGDVGADEGDFVVEALGRGAGGGGGGVQVLELVEEG